VRAVTLPLAGIRVLEFSEHGFVPVGVAALADWGADVIKIERLEGDACRLLLASGIIPDADGFDYQFETFNRNKRGIALDVTTPAGRVIFEKLVRWADVYVTNQLPRVMRKLRTTSEDLFAIQPALVFARGHGQGQVGPDAEAGGFDGVSYWARGGIAHMLTPAGAEHVTSQRPGIGDIPSGLFLAAGVCAALVHTRATGKGVTVDTSLLNGAIWTLQPDLAYASITGTEPPPISHDPTRRSPLIFTYKTGDDRWINLTMLDEDRYWEPTCLALGLGDLIEFYPDQASRLPHRPALHARIAAAIADLPAPDVVSKLAQQGCIFSLVASPPEVVRDPATVANGYLMEHPTHPPLRIGAAPAQFDSEQLSIRRPAPRLGEHTHEILLGLGYSGDDIATLETDTVVTSDVTSDQDPR
jgi:crotonobetainyl-CoA:carnitine CoA-transferase CaiB-like acyl-CoA transferase